MRSVATLIGLSASLLLGGASASDWSHRAGRTGFHGAIAWHAPTEAIGYAYDFRSARDARRAALVQCAHAECEVIAHVRNACAVALRRKGEVFIGEGATRDEALLHARQKCRAGCDDLGWVCTK